MRILYQPRMNMIKNPVIVFEFEGIIGDFIRKQFWDPNTEQIYIRNQAIQSLNRLKENYQMALISTLPMQKLQIAISLLKSKGFTFDAVYSKFHKSKFTFNQILMDFCLLTEKKQLSSLIVSINK